jgi:hypothetical protein
VIDRWFGTITDSHDEPCFHQTLSYLYTLEIAQQDGHEVGMNEQKASADDFDRKCTWVAAFLILFTVICVIVIGAVRNDPIKDRNVVVFVRILIAILAGVIGRSIPGMLTVQAKYKGFWVRGTSAAAMFVIAYMATPAVMPIGDVPKGIEENADGQPIAVEGRNDD